MNKVKIKSEDGLTKSIYRWKRNRICEKTKF